MNIYLPTPVIINITIKSQLPQLKIQQLNKATTTKSLLVVELGHRRIIEEMSELLPI